MWDLTTQLFPFMSSRTCPFWAAIYFSGQTAPLTAHKRSHTPSSSPAKTVTSVDISSSPSCQWNHDGWGNAGWGRKWEGGVSCPARTLLLHFPIPHHPLPHFCFLLGMQRFIENTFKLLKLCIDEKKKKRRMWKSISIFWSQNDLSWQQSNLLFIYFFSHLVLAKTKQDKNVVKQSKWFAHFQVTKSYCLEQRQNAAVEIKTSFGHKMSHSFCKKKKKKNPGTENWKSNRTGHSLVITSLLSTSAESKWGSASHWSHFHWELPVLGSAEGKEKTTWARSWRGRIRQESFHNS